MPLGENDLILAAIEDHPILPDSNVMRNETMAKGLGLGAVQHSCGHIDVEKQLSSGSHAPDLAILSRTRDCLTRERNHQGPLPLGGPGRDGCGSAPPEGQNQDIGAKEGLA